MALFETLLAASGGGQGLMTSGMSVLGGLRDDDRNARAAADQRQADERGAERQMAFQSQESSTARQFAERMASTAHSRQVADMRAAGLNPILSATGGHGASSPTVGAPSGSKAGAALQSGSNTGLGIVTSAQASQRLTEELKNMRRTNDLISAQTDQAKSQAAYNSVLYNRGLVETKTETERMRDMFNRANISEEEAKGAKIEGDIDEGDYGRFLRYMNRASGSVNSGSRIFELFNQRSRDRQNSRNYRDRWGMQD